jgi:hypothetical protein
MGNHEGDFLVKRAPMDRKTSAETFDNFTARTSKPQPKDQKLAMLLLEVYALKQLSKGLS